MHALFVGRRNKTVRPERSKTRAVKRAYKRRSYVKNTSGVARARFKNSTKHNLIKQQKI